MPYIIQFSVEYNVDLQTGIESAHFTMHMKWSKYGPLLRSHTIYKAVSRIVVWCQGLCEDTSGYAKKYTNVLKLNHDT